MKQLLLTIKKLSIAFVFGSSHWVIAQQATINGRLIDTGTGEPLVYANVFLNNTTIGSVTNAEGEFTVKGIVYPAVYEVVFSYVGYESYKQKISITEEKVAMGLMKLKPLAVELNSVEVISSRDKNWEKSLKKFKKIFLGEDKYADLCEIINAYSINFSENDKSFIANSVAPIEIENRALGYRVFFSLNKFESAKSNYTIEGNVRFETLESFDASEKRKWEANRQKAYLNSRQHLFKSILEKKIGAEGFELYTEKEGVSITNRAPVFTSNLGTTLQPFDTINIISPTQYQGIYKIALKGRMEIHYTPSETYSKVYEDITHPVSWIWPNKPFVLVTKDGIELNPLDVTVSGNMSSNRVAQLMPLDFKPSPSVKQIPKANENVTIPPLEKIYIHTDKPYYYPGEIIWFKGYVNYNQPNAADTLSRTAYLELIHKNSKAIVLTKILPIDSGSFYGELTLPDSLKPSNYMLRSYTNWNRNFDESDFFIKQLPILKLNERIEESLVNERSVSSSFDIRTEKPAYRPREKVYVILQSTEHENTVANLSISVIDENQVSTIETNSILADYKIKPADAIKKKNYSFPIETGISFSGRFFDDNFSPAKATLNVVQFNPSNFFLAEADEKGYFKIKNLQFSDSSVFSIQASNKKGVLSGKVELLKRDIAPVKLVPESPPLKVIATTNIMRRKSIFNTDEAQLLEEVVVKDTKEEVLEKRRPYGKSNFVLERKDINTSYPNLLYALQGKFPGLIVREVNNPDAGGTVWMVYTTRAATSSISNVKEVTVLINDVFMGGTPAQILSSINPEDVASVELKTSLSALYGTAGSSGVLSVYTNKAPEIPRPKNIPTVKVSGYSTSKKFKAPEYTASTLDTPAKNLSSTIYWNPVVKTTSEGGAVVSFFSGDQPTKYRVIIEGVNSKNEPIFQTYSFEVRND